MEPHPVREVDVDVLDQHREVPDHPQQRDRRRQGRPREVRASQVVDRNAEQRSDRDAEELAIFRRGQGKSGRRQAEVVDGGCRDRQSGKVEQKTWVI